MARKKKVSYNPFKMWGSYVGAIILLIFQYYRFSSTTINSTIGKVINIIPILPSIGEFGERFLLDNGIINLNTQFIQLVIFSSLITISIGFLIGWGVHSLWRYFNK